LRFQAAAHPDVSGEEIRWRVEAELGVEAAQGAEFPGIEDLADGFEAPGVHEHDAVHELDVVRLASAGHFGQIGRVERAWLFAEDVLSGLSGADDPLLAQAGGQGDVNRLNRGIREEFLVGAEGLGAES